MEAVLHGKGSMGKEEQKAGLIGGHIYLIPHSGYSQFALSLNIIIILV